MPRSDLIAAVLALAVWPAAAGERVTVATWGGAYEAAQRAALFAPFEAETGIAVETATHAGGLGALETRAEAEGWQVVDMLEADAHAACAAGLLAEVDWAALLAPADGIALAEDFAPTPPGRCALPQNVFATVLAYDERAFPGLKPTRVDHLFDLDRFPGRRALEKRPDAVLEWALMAEGVPPAQVYDLLSTERGLRLAFARLETIREAILWWTDPAEPAEMLADGRAAMASGYNGRFFAAAREGGAPLVTLWDGRLVGLEVWAIPAHAAGDAAAKAFLAHAATPEAMARLAERIPYGPARTTAFARIGLHARLGIPMRAHLPNAPGHDGRVLRRDSAWYAATRALRARRFEAWLAGGG